MDSNTNSPTKDIDEATGAFRKRTNDATSRKYRRRSPASRSSSSDESPKRDLSASPILLKDEKRRKHDNKDDRVSSQFEHGRDSDSRRYSSRSYHGYSRGDGHSRGGKYVDEEERSHSRLSSRSGRESKGSVYSDYRERGGDYNRSRDYYHDKDKYDRDRSNASGRDNRDKYDDRDRRARDRDYRDEKRDYRRSSRDYRNDRITSSEELRRKQDDMISRRASKGQEEADKNDTKAEYKPKHLDEERKKYDDGVYKEPQEGSKEESTVKRPKLFSFDSNDPITGSNQGQELLGKGTPGQTSVNAPETVGNLDAAKVAAMKAAELVNKNLIGTGVMTADQKKKLLWGNKKSTITEESSHRWDAAIFPDRERQEKFNKLMSLRLRWYIWPIVGCEGRCEGGAEANKRSASNREAARTSDGFGKAIHCRASAKRWTHCGARSVGDCSVPVLTTAASCNIISQSFYVRTLYPFALYIIYSASGNYGCFATIALFQGDCASSFKNSLAPLIYRSQFRASCFFQQNLP